MGLPGCHLGRAAIGRVFRPSSKSTIYGPLGRGYKQPDFGYRAHWGWAAGWRRGDENEIGHWGAPRAWHDPRQWPTARRGICARAIIERATARSAPYAWKRLCSFAIRYRCDLSRSRYSYYYPIGLHRLLGE